MKLFLCGGGSGKQIMTALNKFSSLLDKNKPILYIPLAFKNNNYDSCSRWFEEEIKFIGLNHFEMVRSSEELSKKDFNNYCALFIGGGNTYKLLKELKENSNFEKINEYLKNNGIIFGGSAGAIIFGKDINSCLIEDQNIVNLNDCTGFNYLNNYSILCHLNNANFKKNKGYLTNYSVKNKTIYLPEDDVIIVTNKKVEFVGKNKYIIFKDGQYTYHNFANIKKDMSNN